MTFLTVCLVVFGGLVFAKAVRSCTPKPSESLSQPLPSPNPPGAFEARTEPHSAPEHRFYSPAYPHTQIGH